MIFCRWRIYENKKKYLEIEKQEGVNLKFAGIIVTEQVLTLNVEHINSKSGYDTFEDTVNYL